MSTTNPLHGRTLAAVDDLSIDEQRYLYRKTREFKEAWTSNGDLTPFRISDPELSVYLMFLEDSTRTKESFRNAVKFHDINLNVFDASSSSFKKSESLVDTVKMLFGYGRRSIFVMRTKMEGVCRALDEQLGEYADRIGRERPVFINAGDGRHEHPTQEFLDEFTFLEQRGWDESHIHVALIGDLQYGRTVHSKADGLKAFHSVIVDLVAPEDLTLPESYRSRMEDNGFEVREWESIEEYLGSGDISDCWYFTRLQLERMGEKIREREYELRQAVTFREEWLGELPENTLFFSSASPAQRKAGYPLVPGWHSPERVGWSKHKRVLHPGNRAGHGCRATGR